MKTMKTILMLGTVLWTVPSMAACHHYSTWNYPYRQTCGIAHRAAEAKNWYVELQLPSETTTSDQRTPAQIQESLEHDAAMAKYHDELLERLNILIISEPRQK